MAIIVEEEKRGANVTRVLMWLVVLFVMGAAIYYVFFSRPEIVGIAAPKDFQNIDFLAGVELKPEEVISDPMFQSLRQYVTFPKPENAGRANPFAPPL